MSDQHPEIIAAPYTIWIAPTGTAFPGLLEEPDEDWTLLGTHGARNQAESGIVFVHDRQWATSTPAGETGESVAMIERESLLVRLEVIDLTLEQYAVALGGNVVTETAPTSTTPGIASVGLAQRTGAARQFAVLVRGVSAYGEGMVSQYELPRCCETGSPQVAYRKGNPAGLDMQIRVLIDPAATSEDTRFGRLVSQFAGVLPPEFTVAPAISGVAASGFTLTGVSGTVTGGTITARAWLRSGTAISGATGTSYVLTPADIGAMITYRETATGPGGTATATSAAVGPVLASIPGGLEVGSESLKFATGNLQVAGQTSVLKQSTTGLGNVLRTAGSFLLARIYIDFDRMNRADTFNLMGNGSAGVQPGALHLRFLPKALPNIFGTRRGKFELYTRQSGGVLPDYVLAGGTMPEVSGWYDVQVRRTGDVTKIDLYDMAGAKVSDGAASALTQANFGVNSFSQSHFYIGDAVDVASEATTSTARGSNANVQVGWEGAIAFVGWGNVAVSDADCEAIALGADPLTRLGASNFTFFRRLRDTSLASRSPVAGTSDTSAPTTVIGTFLPGGTPGRRHPTDYVTLDPVPDYHGFGFDPDTGEALVPVSGKCNGVTWAGVFAQDVMEHYGHRREARYIAGTMQVRYINDTTLVPLTAWQQVCPISVTGVTDGRTFTENSRSAVCVDVLINGQSQMGSFARGTSLNNTVATPSVAMVRQEAGVVEPTAIAFQTLAEVGNYRTADGVAQLAKVVQARALAAIGQNVAVRVVFNAVDGTGISSLLDDWVRGSLNTLSLLAYAGNGTTVDCYNWHSTDAGQGANFGPNVLGAAYLGTGPLATANKLPNIRRPNARIVIAVGTRETTTDAGPFDTDQSVGIALVRQSARATAEANGWTVAPEQIDMKLAAGNGPHQDQSSVRGNPRIFGRMGEGIARALGWSTSIDPRIDNTTPRFAAGKASFTFEVDLPNPGSNFRVDDTATFGSNIQGIEISANNQASYSRSGFVATMTQIGPNRGRVTVTKSSGNWSSTPAGQFWVRYAWGGPFSYGTSEESAEKFRGLMYDGIALEGGLGLPVRPLAPTVVAEP